MILRILLLLTIYNYSIYSTIAQQRTATVFFKTNKYILTSTAKNTLDKIKIDSLISSISIFGYADYRASVEHNKALSINRANAVKYYLQSVNYKIIVCTGKGELPNSHPDSINGVANHRKTEIIFTRIRPNLKQIPQKIIKRDTIITPKLFDIDSIEVGQNIILKNLYFIGGRHFLRPQSKNTALKLVQIMKDNPTLKIEIQGHICCNSNGKDGYDYDTKTNNLSVNRAKYIHHYLVQNGIHRNRLKYKGFARSKPLYPLERTPEEQNKNRRVEIKILEK